MSWEQATGLQSSAHVKAPADPGDHDEEEPSPPRRPARGLRRPPLARRSGRRPARSTSTRAATSSRTWPRAGSPASSTGATLSSTTCRWPSTRSCSTGWPVRGGPLGHPEPRPVLRPGDGPGAPAPRGTASPWPWPCPAPTPGTRPGLEAGLREIADAAGLALIVYLKEEGNFGSDLEAGLDAVARLVDAKVCVAIKYAVVRPDPRRTPTSRPAPPRGPASGDQRHRRAARGSPT